jgi:pimeloyl-ACP methyl ester carboxylesterase
MAAKIPMPEKLTLKTQDGIDIAALYWPAEGRAERLALLLHMMPSTKESWLEFAPLLVERGFAALAIDLRGHGESKNPDDPTFDYRLFEDRDHMAKRLDVEAAADWLIAKAGLGRERMAVVGASIGANLAIQFEAEHPEVPAAVALSPGWDYHGVTTPDKVEKMGPEQALMVVASEEDERSYLTDRDLKEIRPDMAVKEFQGLGHGTTIFVNRPEFMTEVADWLSEKVPKG